MRLPATADKFLVILRRDVVSAARYRNAFWIRAMAMLIEIAGAYYLARAVGPSFRPEGIDYYSFLLIGTGFFGLVLSAVNSFITTVHEAQTTGTMEVLMTTSTSPPLLILLNAASVLMGRTLQMVVYVGAGLLLFQALPQRSNLLGAALVLALSLAVALAVGIIAAAVQIAIQKGGALVWLLGSVGWLLTGTMFPVNALPRPFQLIAAIVPFKYSLDGLRLALFRAAPFAELAPALAALTAFALVLLPLSLLLISRALRNARLQGTLSFY